MQETSRPIGEAAGIWLGTGASLLIVALIFHGPPDPDLTVQMEHVAHGHERWAAVHWTAAVALLLLSGAGFLNLIDRTTEKPPLLASAWLIMALGALLTISTAVAEAAAVAAAAAAGDQAAFVFWWQFASGMANGFFALALAVALIAWSEVRARESRLPGWLSFAGAAFGVLSAIGWMLGQHLAIGIGGPIWLVSTLLMSAWLAFYGFSGARRRHPANAAQTTRA